MEIINLSIDRIIIHQVFRRNENGEVPPEQSTDYTRFEESAMSDFESRVISALGKGSRAVVMEVTSQESGDLAEIVDRTIDHDDTTFITSSFEVATKLSKAQTTKAMSGGIVVIFTGKYGYPQKNFFGVIKAEIHSGYEKLVDPVTKQISLKHIEELLLTPSSRLYKTIGFFEKDGYDPATTNLNEKWSVLISDNQISQTEGQAAARYFYEGFAGCGYPQTSAKTTREYYEATNEFICKMSIPVEKKNDLLNALNTYLKVNNSVTIDPVKFSEDYFDTDTQDLYIEYLEENAIPTMAFTKDIEHIQNKLKARRVTFSNNAKIIASPEIFKDEILIHPYDGEVDPQTGQKPQWTQIIVKSKIDLSKE